MKNPYDYQHGADRRFAAEARLVVRIAVAGVLVGSVRAWLL